MRFFNRPSSSKIAPAQLLCAAVCSCSIISAHAQSQEEFELQNGRRIPAESVKVAPNGFTASLTVGTALQTLNFTAKEVTRVTLREPKEVVEARNLIASEKPDKAFDILQKAEPALLPYQAIPDSWWLRAAILRMDALAVLGKAKDAAEIASADVLSKLPPENASLLKDFKQLVAPPAKDASEKLDSLRSMSERIIDPWVAARVWLEIGNTLAAQGKMEDAVKSWLRVPVFFPAERDLAARGTILGARGLQQIDRPADGIKLLKDYLADHLGSPYKETILNEIVKLEPKRQDATAAEAPKEPANSSN